MTGHGLVGEDRRARGIGSDSPAAVIEPDAFAGGEGVVERQNLIARGAVAKFFSGGRHPRRLRPPTQFNVTDGRNAEAQLERLPVPGTGEGVALYQR